MSNDTRSRPMTAETIHTCSYECERPGCIRAQRDELLSRLAAATAALEAALVDAERYRWLRKGSSDEVAVVRDLGAMDYGMSAVVYTYSEEIDGDDLDAAIDAAMRKEGRGDE